ncbi:MAG: lamin tail domain-containing protein [Saprospiraceae bacterium]|nr:lamin tail domain-containing protein [Saprospiraceae bacterium]
MKRTIFTLLALVGLFANGFTQNVVITEINYNPPGVDNYEFVELYNNGASVVELEGWTISSAINYTFPIYSLDPGEYVVVCNNLMSFEAGFGFQALEWDPAGNALNNVGENIVVKDAAGVFVDSVHYSNTAPWPSLANGFGPSLVLCDVNTDNSDPANWAPALTATGIVVNNIEMLANPGDPSNCLTGPLVSFMNSNVNIQENAGNVSVTVVLANGNANPTTVTLNASIASTATFPGDYSTTFPLTITFPGGMSDNTQTVSISILDDTDIEPNEVLMLELTDPTNGATILGSGFTINITDNDTPLTGALLISGVFDTQVEAGGTWAKGCELRALTDIPDLSIFAVGFANNGGGTDGPEVTLPAISVLAGECITVANDSILFHNFFGYPPTIADSDAGINGDDAIELFENSQVIDVFGDITYPVGSTLAWNYLDGWVYRKSGTGPDGALFNVDNWNYSGQNVFDLQTSNATALVPFPDCTYSPIPPSTAVANDDNVTGNYNAPVTINILANDVLPITLATLTVTNPPANGTVSVNGLDNLTYTPDANFCGTDQFEYQICDANGCDFATVNITIDCPANYPVYDIADVTTVDANGQPDSLGVTCELRGIVYGIDYQGVNAMGQPLNALQFYLINNGGISVFSADQFGYTVQEGDELAIRGEIAQFNCLAQISNVDTIIVLSTGNALISPAVTTFLDESFESELVELTNLTMVDPGQWLGDGSSFNVEVTNGTFTNTMRIDNDCELSSWPAPLGPFHARGLGGQFDTAPCDGGYQFLPRYAADIIPLGDATEESWLEGKISFYPNPVSDQLFLKTDIIIDDVIVANAHGQQMMQVKSPSSKLDVSQLEAGLYLISFRAAGGVWTSKFVKQ